MSLLRKGAISPSRARSPIILEDDFYYGGWDPDPTKWNLFKVGVMLVSCWAYHLNANAGFDGIQEGGVVTLKAYKLSGVSIQSRLANVWNAWAGIFICPTKTTNTLVQNEPSYYGLIKYRHNYQKLTMVLRRLTGQAATTQYSGPGGLDTGSLKMDVKGGKIYFYEDDSPTYQEDYALATDLMYAYFVTYSSTHTFAGPSWHDDLLIKYI